MNGFLQDVRHSLRIFGKNPGFTAVVVLTLALGIGANSAIFSVVNGILLRPLPYPESDRLFLIRHDLPRLDLFLNTVSAAEFIDYRDGNKVFSQVAGYETLPLNLTGQGDAQRVEVGRVSADLFPLLGVAPLLGRAFTTEEDQAGNDGVAVIGENLWRSRFGADSSVIGKIVKLDEKPYAVVGVMPGRFQFPPSDSSYSKAVDVWIPLAMTDKEKLGRADSFDYGLIGRLKPGVTPAQAQADIATVAERMEQQHPDIYQGNIRISGGVVGLEQKTVMRVRPALLILPATVGLVLLIACANVANLLLARSAARKREIAVRSALGATGSRLVRQFLTESLLLALVGGTVGLFSAAWAVQLLVKFGPRDVPRLAEVDLDWRVLVFTMFVSVLTGAAFGLAPAWQSMRLDLNDALKDAGGRTVGGCDGRLRRSLIVFETACAFVLLVGAGLLVNSFVRLLRVPPGFDPEGVVIAQTSMPTVRFSSVDQGKQTYRRILDRLDALPGVESVAAATNPPFVGNWEIAFRVEGDTDNKINLAASTLVGSDYFRTVGIRLLQGTTLADEKRDGVVSIVVNEAMARRYWPGQNPIGKRIRWGGWPTDWLTVAGVADNVKTSSLEAEDKPTVYMPIFQTQRLRRNVVFVARTSGDPAGLVAAMRREIQAVDSEVPVFDVRPMTHLVAESVSQRKFSMVLLGLFAVSALLLAAVGLYGVTAHDVTRRTREIGIRTALGATRTDIFRLILSQGIRPVALGLVLGLPTAFGTAQLMKSLLFGVAPNDPTTFTAIPVVLVAVAVLACLIPARRATRVDPMTALRTE